MSNRMLRGLGLGAAIAGLWLAMVAAPAAAAGGKTRWVANGTTHGGPKACRTASFSTIQDAINASHSYDTVMVCPGTYREQLDVDKTGLTVESATIHGAHIVAPASMEEFDGLVPLVLLENWGDRLILFDIGIASGDIPVDAQPNVSAQDGVCSHVDVAVWGVNGHQGVSRNVIHPNGPYSLSGACGYDYGIVMGLSEPVAASKTDGTILTGADVSHVSRNGVSDFRYGGILAEGDVSVQINLNKVTFLHTNDPECSAPFPGSAPSASPAACDLSAPDKLSAKSLQKGLSHPNAIGNVTSQQVNSEFEATFGIGAEGGAAVDIDFNRVHSGLEFAASNSILGGGIWTLDVDSSSRIFNNVVTNAYLGIATGFGGPDPTVVSPATATDGVWIIKNLVEDNFLGIGISTDANNITKNTATANFEDGITIVDGAGNWVHGNNFAFNYTFESGLDCDDETTGSGTDGTNSTWTNNLGVFSDPDGLCTVPNVP